MFSGKTLSPERVRELREQLGYDLRVEVAADWKAKIAVSKPSLLKTMEVPSVASAATTDAFMLPTVGRHTQALERQPMAFIPENKAEPKIRKPRAPEQPDLKKAKLELPDVSMLEVEPGDPIDSQASAESDATHSNLASLCSQSYACCAFRLVER